MVPFTQALSSRRTEDWLTGSLLDTYADTYVRNLSDRGHLPGTMKLYLSAIAHFARWCGLQRLELSQVDERTTRRFIERHLPSCRCAIRCMRQINTVEAALTQLVTGLRSDGHTPPVISPIPAHIAGELKDFESHMSHVRGLADLTRHSYLRFVEDFLLELFRRKPVKVTALQPCDIARFVERRTVGYKPISIKSVNAALRSYFAFKAVHGEQTERLCAALPRVALWRLAKLPQIVSPEDIDRLLRTYDRTRAAGKRDYAIARCLIDLGLRRTEVARLRLDDIDWREGVLRIPAKGPRVDLLPLPHVTGRAIADYLRDGRPKTTRRELFVRHTPPLNGPASLDLIRGAIRCAAARCGLKERIRGTHILRHTVAGRLVQAGTPLKQIADLLRHRDIDTTTIYAKADLPALTRVAMPWPGSQA